MNPPKNFKKESLVYILSFDQYHADLKNIIKEFNKE